MQQAPTDGGQGFVAQLLPMPWNTPPAAAHWFDVRVAQLPSARQQAPTSAGGMKSTRSTGRWLTVETSRLSKRFDVLVVLSSPRISQPKFVPELFNQSCTSATRPVEDHE